MKFPFVATAFAFCALLQACANSGQSSEPADCQSIGISGRYRDASDPVGMSLAKLLAEKTVGAADAVQLSLGAEALTVSAGPFTKVLVAGKDFVCSSDGRVTLKREDSSRILLPPLIDQTKTMTYVLTAGNGGELVLTTYARTVALSYGVKIQGPLQLESRTTWRLVRP